MAQVDLLTAAPLRLNDNIRRGAPQKGCVLLRAPHSRIRLAVTPVQVEILSRFTPKTVAEVLVNLLQEQRCPPLSEYYELVRRAREADILVAADAPVEAGPGGNWKLRLRPKMTGNVAGILFLLALVGLGLGLGLAPRAPAGAVPVLLWVGGWLLACALLSAGEALAAGALAGGDCEVRWPHFHWRSLLPSFRVDTAEAAMAGRDCLRAVAALRVVPLAIGAAVVAWKMPGALLPLLAGLLFVLAPWRGSAMAQWLQSLRERPRFAVRPGQLFVADDDDVWADWQGWWAGVETRVATGWSGWAVAWSLLLGATIHYFFPAGTARLLAWAGQTQHLRALLSVLLYAVATVLLLGAVAVAWAGYRHWRIRRELTKPMHSPADRKSPAFTGETLEVLKQLALFQALPEEELTALAGAMSRIDFAPKQEVFREDDPGDAFYVVLEGQLEVLKKGPGKKPRTATIGWLGPGEAFGEIALLENTGRTSTIRARRPSRLLRLGKTEFEQLLLGRLGAARVREVLQYARFLGRLAFLGDWPFDDLVRYAQRCTSLNTPASKRVIKRGDHNLWFFLIFDGAFEARVGDRVLRRMGPGDYFGEISLLANDVATADVVAVEDSRCLTMGREDFLTFFSKDYRIGLRMETQASYRLGKDLFIARQR